MGKSLKPVSSSREVDAFIESSQLPSVVDGGGRLLFALDATASREATWDRACQLQSEMFLVTTEVGTLNVQLCYYRGYRQFHASRWVSNARDLLDEMNDVSCLGGHTQIARVLKHALQQAQQQPLHALVLIGDCCEEALDPLCEMAGELGLRGTPIFAFHEGEDPTGLLLFQQLAKLSGGAWARFDLHSADHLKTLLSAAAVYATGGYDALERFAERHGDTVLQLTHQLRRS